MPHEDHHALVSRHPVPTVRNLSDLKRSYEVPRRKQRPLTSQQDHPDGCLRARGRRGAVSLRRSRSPADLLEAGWLGTEVTITPGANRGLAQRTTRILFWVAPAFAGIDYSPRGNRNPSPQVNREPVVRGLRMHIVIMGCGRVGASLARGLEARGHSVAVIDSDPDSFRRLGPDFKGQTLKGIGFDRKTLEAAGIRHADGFAAVSSGDNSNILAARVVRETFGVSNVAARIYDQGRAEVYERMGISTVAPVRWAAIQILRRLMPEGSEPQWQDPSGKVRLIQVNVHPDWVGRRIIDIARLAGAPLPFLSRFGSGMVPDESTILQDGDLVYAAVSNERVAALESALGSPPTR